MGVSLYRTLGHRGRYKCGSVATEGVLGISQVQILPPSLAGEAGSMATSGRCQAIRRLGIL